MDIKNLSYEYLKIFFNEYFDKKELNNYYFCENCKRLRRKYNNIYDDDSDDKDIKFLHSILDFINSNYTCNKEITNCINANVVPVNLNHIEHNLHIEGINDICKYPNLISHIIYNYTDTEKCEYMFFYCEICKFIRIIDSGYYSFVEIVLTKNGIKYSPMCIMCNELFPDCCIDYHIIPNLLNVHENICIECDNKINPVNLKPAKR
jgi:hypothetical protein